MKAADAIAAAKRGWHVFPVVPGGKEPLGHWPTMATTNLARVVTYWSSYPNANIGIAMKPSGLLVIDCDHPPQGINAFAKLCSLFKAYDAVDTYTVKTGSGGLHFYYRWPSTVKASQASLVPGLVDVRCNGGRDGGYVLGAGSQTDKGGYQVWGEDDDKVIDCPRWLQELVVERERARPVREPATADEFMCETSYAGVINSVRLAQEGNRNHALHWAACVMAEDGVSMERAEEMLVEAADAAGLTYRETEATIRSAYRNRRSA